ncbi:hypothetical protein HXX76_011164 [Chlamydomonas incerta]|uniref:TRP C-terminal domain-containing protein n=1 Tax=Chlamydomonas incerta TaxID=51695 RepID=A0A835VV04_CHLIN|nr:hypothetical protein HXX76_011164 [Chlamydomonas incerta]|eukprot:KAG2428920.1 hypothetical protein HXX76_011164 [Chlamydomonas incerta]
MDKVSMVGNRALTGSGHGDDIASSAFYLQANDIVDYYTSFEALPINATMYDFYGQACKGYATQPPVQVRMGGLRTEADGTLVNLEVAENMNKSGLTIAGRTVVMSEDGQATFLNTRLRAPEGPRVLELNATLTKPVRDLASVRLLVYVRPCTIGEFLDPTTKDMCIGCPLGTYNMMPSATQCETCPDNTNCTAPEEGAMMLPDDGYWQSNLYSEQVLECPNPDSCTYDERGDALREIQAVTWWAVKWMQGNASQRASMNTLADQKWKELLARRVMLGANVDVVKPVETMSEEEFVNAVYNLTYEYNQNYTTTLCAEGYEGTLCGACIRGWGLVDEASCIKCPSKALNDLYYALATIFTIFTIGMTVLSSLEAQKTARDIRDHGMDVVEVQMHTEKLHELDPAGEGWHGKTSLNPARDSIGPADGSRPGSRAASVITAGGLQSPKPGSQPPHPDAYEGPDSKAGGPDSKAGGPGPVAEATETDGAAAAPAPAPSPAPPAAQQASGSGSNDSDLNSNSTGAVNVGAVAILFDDDKADGKPKPDVASAGSGSAPQAPGAAAGARPEHNNSSGGDHKPSGAQRQGSVTGGLNSGRLPPTREEEHGNYQGLTDYEIDELKRAEEEIREEVLNRYAANQSTIMRIFISYIQVLALLRNVPIRYPDAYNNYLKLNNQATAYPGDIVTMDCSLPYYAAGGLPRSMLKVILSCASPLYILLGFAILTLFGDMAIYYKKRKSRAKLRKAETKRGKGGKGVPLGEGVEAPEPHPRASGSFVAGATSAPSATASAAGAASALAPVGTFGRAGGNAVLPASGPNSAAGAANNNGNSNPNLTPANTFARVSGSKPTGPDAAAGGALPTVNSLVRGGALPTANSFARGGSQPVYGANSGALFCGLVKDGYCPTSLDDPLRNYGAFLWDRYFSQVMVMMIVIFFVLYPDVVDNLLSIFSCADVDFDKDGNPLAVKMGLYNKQVWTVDYNVTCYEGQHFVLAMALGIPGIVLFAAGWPSINAVLMSPLGRRLCGHKTRFTEDMTDYYLNDYNPNFIWWESIVMLRKLGIALATTFLGSRDTDTGLNLLICMSILVVAVSLQLWFRPYHHAETNGLEAGSICVLLLTLYLSLYFLLDSSVVSDSGAIAVSAVIITVNVVMVVIFLFYVMRSHWHSYIKDLGFDADALRGMSRVQIHEHMSKVMDDALPGFVPGSVKSVITRAATGTLVHTVALQKRFSSGLTVGTSATTTGTHSSGPLSPTSQGADGSKPNLETVNSIGRPKPTDAPQSQGSMGRVNTLGRPPTQPERVNTIGRPPTQPERVNTLARDKDEPKPKPGVNPIDRLKSGR